MQPKHSLDEILVIRGISVLCSTALKLCLMQLLCFIFTFLKVSSLMNPLCYMKCDRTGIYFMSSLYFWDLHPLSLTLIFQL